MSSNGQTRSEKILISLIIALGGFLGGIFGMATGQIVLALPVLATGLLGITGLYHVYDKPNKDVVIYVAVFLWFVSFVPVLLIMLRTW